MRPVNDDTAPGPDGLSELTSLVERFEAAWQAGQRPDIDAHLPPGPGRRAALVELAHVELEWRLKAGEAARVEDYLGRFPELADDTAVVLELVAAEYALRRRCEPGLSTADYERRFPALSGQLPSRLGTDGQGPAEAPSTRDEGPALPGTHAEGTAGPTSLAPGLPGPPRYQPVRFHARGGLGEVHVARDGELGREVALKRIRPEHAHDPESRARFLREAEVTARLEHPGVVPVHGLMLDEDGQPCYAMRFVQGQTLAEAVRRFHQADQAGREPGERAVALRGLLARFVAVCDTIAYAHARGVLHRDIKPANVMLGPYGETLVLDWGLAKPFDRGDEARSSGEESVMPAAGAGAGGTGAGQAVGTPAYMAPEQAAGRWAEVGPASDVYGLGATLYELLAGAAPLRGPAREVLGRAQRGDFPPPRQVNRRVPPALEAVCLKAMAPRPGQRYGSAGALKDDVESWLAGERVGAWREPLRVRAGRWARRHRTQVAALAAAALVAVLAGGAGTWWLGRQRAQTRQEVEAGLAQVVQLQGQARWGEAQAVLGQAERRLGAGGPRDLRERLEQARDELALVARLDGARLRRATAVEGRLDNAGADREYEEAFRPTGVGGPGGDPSAAAAWVRGTGVREALVAALDDWALCAQGRERRAWVLEVARRADPGPWRDAVRDPAAWDDRAALTRLAQDERAARQSPQLLATVGQRLLDLRGDGERLLRAAQDRHPGDFWVNFALGMVLSHSRRPDEAVGYYRAAVALRPGAAAVHNDLGNALHQQGKQDEAIAEYRRAVELAPDLALGHNNLGKALHQHGQRDEAVAAFRRAVALDPKYAKAHYNLGLALYLAGQREEAIAEYRLSIGLDPGHVDVHVNLGAALREQGKPDEAVAEYRRALALDDREAPAHLNLAVVLREQGKGDEALAEYRRAVECDPKLAAAHAGLGAALYEQGKPDEAAAAYRRALALDDRDAVAHAGLGAVLMQQGKPEEAVAEYRRAVALDPKLALALYNLGVALYGQGKLGEAETALRRAVALGPELAQAHGALGALLLRRGQFAEARRSTQRCLEALAAGDPLRRAVSGQLQRCERMLALEAKLPAAIEGKASPAGAAERLALAGLCGAPYKRLYLAAARFYADAFAAEPKLADDLAAGHRYNAACAAALAAAGGGEGAAGLDEKERARWREQAVGWLRADLASWGKQVERDTPRTRAAVRKTLRHWLGDPDLANVRDGAALEKLPEAERAACRRLWADVAALLKRCEGTAPGPCGTGAWGVPGRSGQGSDLARGVTCLTPVVSLVGSAA
jgi:serine/threonine-protein kinase